MRIFYFTATRYYAAAQCAGATRGAGKRWTNAALRALLLLVLVGLATPAAANTPSTIRISGVLRGAGGEPVVDGGYGITFSLYNKAVDGKVVWKEGPLLVQVSGGVFGHSLGTKVALTAELLVGLQPGWLGVQVGADPELPRQTLHSVTYALQAATADKLSCSGCVGTSALAPASITADKLAFSYAASKTKGGPATDLACTGCVGVAELSFDGDVDLGGNGLKAKNIAADVVTAGAVSAVSYTGDGSKLTGLKVASGSCSKPGEVVKGIGPDGSLVCTVASALPADGISAVSNNLIFNTFTDEVASAKTPLGIKDNDPIGMSDTIDVPSVGKARKLTVKVALTNSDVGKLVVSLYDPKNVEHMLSNKAGNGVTLTASWTEQSKLTKGGLGAWVGKDPKGKWRLKVIDSAFTNNKLDGELKSWSLAIETLSASEIEVKGQLKFRFNNRAAHPMACDADHSGQVYLNTKQHALMVCETGAWRPIYLANNGDSPKTAGKSCLDLLQNGVKVSGSYWIQPAGQAFLAACDMVTAGGGWTRLVEVDPVKSGSCPVGWLFNANPKVCKRTAGASGCRSASFSSFGLSYKDVRGRAAGYQWGSMDGFHGNDIDGAYVDGLSLTYGAPRQHLWTYAVGLFDHANGDVNKCPCNGGSAPGVGDGQYFCESGNASSSWQSIWYSADVLWDGKACVAGSCCKTAGQPWFQRTLAADTSSAIEARLCSDQETTNEDVGISSLEVWVR